MKNSATFKIRLNSVSIQDYIFFFIFILVYTVSQIYIKYIICKAAEMESNEEWSS